jgi:hypothetical protein
MFKSFGAIMIATTALVFSASAESLSENADKAAHQVKDAVVGSSISQLPEKGETTISGTVSYIDTLDNEFTLRDDSGSIDVEQEDKLAVSVGDSVTVSGVIAEDMGEKEITASKVSITKKAEDKTSQNAN